mmetsp:Transcript_34011/g.97833  ORF Transcript_34011/g.97833 Transcript_34011/m.97833 type:complete len:206 (+) Transcript_34011:489-1106(+)
MEEEGRVGGVRLNWGRHHHRLLRGLPPAARAEGFGELVEEEGAHGGQEGHPDDQQRNGRLNNALGPSLAPASKGQAALRWQSLLGRLRLCCGSWMLSVVRPRLHLGARPRCSGLLLRLVGRDLLLRCHLRLRWLSCPHRPLSPGRPPERRLLLHRRLLGRAAAAGGLLDLLRLVLLCSRRQRRRSLRLGHGAVLVVRPRAHLGGQ